MIVYIFVQGDPVAGVCEDLYMYYGYISGPAPVKLAFANSSVLVIKIPFGVNSTTWIKSELAY